MLYDFEGAVLVVISNDNLYDKTMQAFEKGKFYELLTGKDEYDMSINKIPVDIPTDWTVIISNGIYQLYNNFPHFQIVRDLEDAIRRMLKGSSTEIWMAAYVIFNLIRNEQIGKAPFSIDRKIFEDFNRALNNKKDELYKNTSYGGKDYYNGLYGDIERLNYILKSKY